MTTQIKDIRIECRETIEKFLQNSPDIPINSRNSVNYIDDVLARYLIENDHIDWMMNDLTQGPQIGRLSEAVLSTFVHDKKIFDNPHLGKYLLKEDYDLMSVRGFQAYRV